MYGVINILLTMLSKIPDGSGKKYHLYDTIPSYILVILRIGLLFSMAYGIYCQVYPLGSSSSKRSQRTKTKDYKLINFLYYFVLLSFFYVLSVIIIIIVCKYVLPTERKHLAFFINELMKKGALFYFCFMLSSKVSMYKRIASS